MNIPIRPITCCTVLIMAARLAEAAPPGAFGPADGGAPGPPPEAIAACSGKSEGAKVSVTLPDGKTISATCKLQGGVLAARPGPPPEAVAACESKVEGDSVSFSLPDGRTLMGTCRLIDGVLAAQPTGPHSPR